MLLLELVVERQVGEVGGVAPAGGVVHAGGGEGTVNAELVLAGLDVVGTSLQLVEGVDVLGLVASLLEQLLVVDDAVALLDPVNAQILAVGLQGKRIVDELAADLGVGQIGAVVLPVLKTGGAIDLEQGRRGTLRHLGLELLLVGVGGGGHDLDLDALLLLVRLGDLLPLLVDLGLKVEEVDLGSVTGSRGAGAGGAAAAHETEAQNRSRGTSEAQELPSAHFVLHYNPPFHTVRYLSPPPSEIGLGTEPLLLTCTIRSLASCLNK